MKSKYMSKKILSTNDDLQNAIIDLYLSVKIRNKEDKKIFTEEEKQREQSNLKRISQFTVIDYIKKSIDILINLRSEERYNEYINSYMTSHQNLSLINLSQYENLLHKQEEQIRCLYGKETQYKFKLSSLEKKITELQSRIGFYENINSMTMNDLQKSSSFNYSHIDNKESREKIVDEEKFKTSEYKNSFIRLSEYENENKNMNHDLIMSFGCVYNKNNNQNNTNTINYIHDEAYESKENKEKLNINRRQSTLILPEEDKKSKSLVLNLLSNTNNIQIKESNKEIYEIEKKIQKQRLEFSNKLQLMEIEYKQKIEKLTEKIEKFEDEGYSLSNKDKDERMYINKNTRNHQSPFEEYEKEINEKANEKKIEKVKGESLYSKVHKPDQSSKQVHNSFKRSNSTMMNKEKKVIGKEYKKQAIHQKSNKKEVSSRKKLESNKNIPSPSRKSTYIYQTINNNYNIKNKEKSATKKYEYRNSIGNNTEASNSNKDLYDSNKTKIINSTEDSDDEKNFTFRNSFSSNINSSVYTENKTLYTNNTNKSNCKVLSTITVDDFSMTERNKSTKQNNFFPKNIYKPSNIKSKSKSKSRSKDFNFHPSLQISPLINNLIKEVNQKKAINENNRKIKNNYSSSTNLNQILIDEYKYINKITDNTKILSIRNSSVNSKKSNFETKSGFANNRPKGKINSHYDEE